MRRSGRISILHPEKGIHVGKVFRLFGVGEVGKAVSRERISEAQRLHSIMDWTIIMFGPTSATRKRKMSEMSNYADGYDSCLGWPTVLSRL
jgi:hypothetical protein